MKTDPNAGVPIIVLVVLIGLSGAGCRGDQNNPTRIPPGFNKMTDGQPMERTPPPPVKIVVTTAPTPTLFIPEPMPTRIIPTQEAVPFGTEIPVAEAPCSPLAKISLDDLQEIVSNPYESPTVGRDNGHPGVDLAFYRWQGYTSIDGHGVQAVWSGRVAGTGTLRLPYGNYVILETPYDRIPSPLREAAGLQPEESMYHLYAHLKNPVSFVVNDRLACGEHLGDVGTTGASVVAHLHLELRAGPLSEDFPQMAYYDTRAQADAMRAYEIWRVRGPFRSLDPAALLFSD